MKAQLQNHLKSGSEEQLKEAIAEAKSVAKGDSEYAEAQEVIAFCEALLDKPKTVRVRAKNDVSVDGKRFEKDQEGEIHEKQYHALACHFHKVALIAILFALFLLQLPASAQQYTAIAISTNGATPLNGGTNNVPAATTNTYNFPITMTKFEDVFIQPVFKLNASGTTPAVFTFDESADNTNWVTRTSTLTITPAGTTTVTGRTNITVKSAGYSRLGTVENSGSAAITNLLVLRALKPTRFGQ